MDHHNLSEHRRCELEELAATRREHGRPAHEIAAEIAQTAAITPLWAWRLAKGWRRSELLQRLRRLADASVEESMLWRWEIGERPPQHPAPGPAVPGLPDPPGPARLQPRGVQ